MGFTCLRSFIRSRWYWHQICTEHRPTLCRKLEKLVQLELQRGNLWRSLKGPMLWMKLTHFNFRFDNLVYPQAWEKRNERRYYSSFTLSYSTKDLLVELSSSSGYVVMLQKLRSYCRRHTWDTLFCTGNYKAYAYNCDLIENEKWIEIGGLMRN